MTILKLHILLKKEISHQRKFYTLTTTFNIMTAEYMYIRKKGFTQT